MEYALSQHATDVMRERRIDPTWITETLTEPMHTEPDADDPQLMHALRRIDAFGSRVLRVIFNTNRVPVLVVTVFFDRGMRGKL